MRVVTGTKKHCYAEYKCKALEIYSMKDSIKLVLYGCDNRTMTTEICNFVSSQAVSNMWRKVRERDSLKVSKAVAVSCCGDVSGALVRAKR